MICLLFHASFLTRVVIGFSYTKGARRHEHDFAQSISDGRGREAKGTANDLGRLRSRLHFCRRSHYMYVSRKTFATVE